MYIKQIANKILKHINFFISLQLTSQQKVKIPIIGSTGKTLRHYELDWMHKLLDKLLRRKSAGLIDVGVNLGQTLIAFQTTQIGSHYIGFEPNSVCTNYLTHLIEANQWNNCEIIPIGLSNNPSLVEFYTQANFITAGTATINKSVRPKQEVKSSFVPVFPLDNIVDSLKITHIDLIKIDVEGAELMVLQGMEQVIKKFQPIIICEILFRDPNEGQEIKEKRDDAIISLLEKHHYTILQIFKTADLRDVDYLKVRSKFSQEVWSQNNKDFCDYLFVPSKLVQWCKNQFNHEEETGLYR